MAQRYDIFNQTTDNLFVWIDAVENVIEGKKRLTSFASTMPGDYHLWDMSRHEFVEGNRRLRLNKAKIVLTAKAGLKRYSWDSFVDEPTSVAKAGKGVVVAGYPRCRRLLNTTDQYLRHLADDVRPNILDRALADAIG
jgi:hypothetical protein